MSNYKFSVINNGTYAPLVNKTVFQTGAQLDTDAISGPIALPFPFSMYDSTENTIFISNNGFVGFGVQPVASAKTVFNAISSSNIACEELISFSNQITSWKGRGSFSEISYGQNDAGDFIIEFIDVSIQTAPGVRMTFQIVLKADGVTVQIVFGPNCTGQDQVSIISPRSFEVGLRGLQTARLNATPFTEVYDNILLPTGDWNKASNIKPGTRPSAGMSVRTGVNMPDIVIANIVRVPKSGLTYQWSIN